MKYNSFLEYINIYLIIFLSIPFENKIKILITPFYFIIIIFKLLNWNQNRNTTFLNINY